MQTNRLNNNLITACFLILIMYFFLYSALGQPILSNNVYDSYTIQAIRWWQGEIALDKDYSWLELAYYDNQIYLSFPPFPSVTMFLLIPFFGQNTPSNLVTTLYALISFIIVFYFCKRKELRDQESIFWAAFVVLGGNILSISCFGGVWYQAQVLSFLLSLLSIYLITSNKEKHWYIALLLWAFAVGCRPFQIIYLPVYLVILYTNLKNSCKSPIHILKFLIAPAIVGMLYGWYNYIRFDNIFEFGHNYLPEFTESEFGQFNWRYIGKNLPNLFRLPFFENGSLSFPMFDGFAFYIANPIFITYICRLIKSLKRKKQSTVIILILILAVIHVILFLSHKTLGGWQFGIRYFVDIIPFLFLSVSYGDLKIKNFDILLMGFGILINLYGTLWLNLWWG
jgi:hypothetical protein